MPVLLDTCFAGAAAFIDTQIRLHRLRQAPSVLTEPTHAGSPDEGLHTQRTPDAFQANVATC